MKRILTDEEKKIISEEIKQFLAEEFEIDSSEIDNDTNIVDETGAVIRRAKTRCKSHRFREQTVVEVTYQSLDSNARLASAN